MIRQELLLLEYFFFRLMPRFKMAKNMFGVGGDVQGEGWIVNGIEGGVREEQVCRSLACLNV